MIEPTGGLLVFDGNNIIMRSLFGMATTGLTGPDGIPSGGLYGAIRAFQSFVAAVQPSHVLWTFDHGRSLFRTALSPEYKANRTSRPPSAGPGSLANFDEVMAATFEAFARFLDLNGVQHYRERGVEADDHIAEAVHRWHGQLPITIISSDHDLRQLCTEDGKVVVVKPRANARQDNIVYDHQRVLDEYGLPPHRLAELWAIQGDVGDNVIGVHGIGPKKALQMITQHGSLDKAIAADPRLRGHERRVFDNYRLITLMESHSTLPFTLDACAFDPKGFDRAGLERYCTDWGLSSVGRMLERGGPWM